jgi:diguanylate cyclase (GGDEF)-like protein
MTEYGDREPSSGLWMRVAAVRGSDVAAASSSTASSSTASSSTGPPFLSGRVTGGSQPHDRTRQRQAFRLSAAEGTGGTSAGEDTGEDGSNDGEAERSARCSACGQPVGYWVTDKLTGLLDRWGWDDEAQQLLRWAGRQGRPVALIVVDLDNFKQINDDLGHLAGDAVLRRAAAVIRSATCHEDLAGRYGGHGGDEFLVLLPGADITAAAAVAEGVRLGIKKMHVRVPAGDGSAPTVTGCTASIGIAGGTLVHGTPLQDLLLRADAALRQAKASGRDQTRVAPSNGDTRLYSP